MGRLRVVRVVVYFVVLDAITRKSHLSNTPPTGSHRLSVLLWGLKTFTNQHCEYLIDHASDLRKCLCVSYAVTISFIFLPTKAHLQNSSR